MGFTTKEGMCRVDFFKPSGKWYTTGEINMAPYYTRPLIHEAFRHALKDAFPNNYHGLDAVCLEPYHEFSHPVQLKAGWNNG